MRGAREQGNQSAVFEARRRQHKIIEMAGPEPGVVSDINISFVNFNCYESLDECYNIVDTTIVDTTNLTILNLGYNQLTGEIPSWIGNLTNLGYLILDNNQLTGDIPQSVCNLIESNDLYIEFIINGNNLNNICD